VSHKRPEIKIVYQDRKEWPKRVVDFFHGLHLKNDTQNPKCPYCNGEWTWKK
jgi:uncharacterized protein with PIN domain